ncbi:hypothetical protein [Photobacterium phosphoreum]|uniref:hypothetical protein n=1 Tax=Photobacterium phosphoreum TaxID=659 RepID=UPI0011B1C86B|nr:hypothetical protein [Photobacterium phosphoreum]
MKIIFIDEENVGTKSIENMDLSILDKVFVFSNKKTIQELCNKKLFLSISDYPVGSNQADFYIIAYLSRILLTISNEEKKCLELVLYTKDKALITAFEFQCELVNISCIFPLIDSVIDSVEDEELGSSVEDMILSLLKNASKSSNEMMTTLNLELRDFTTPINVLINNNKIKRNPNDKKLWVLS